MAVIGRPRLRDLFDDASTPHIAHPPHTHQRDFYLATDGSFSEDGSGLGVIIETRSGTRVARLAVPDKAPDNNVAEYRALHLGLDTLADRSPKSASVGVLLDHDDLAGNVNAAVLAGRNRDFRPLTDITLPPSVAHHWRGIRARIAGFGEVRAAKVDSRQNPAHPLANAPEEYTHVNEEPDRCLVPALEDPEPAGQVPPPSRADRHASD